MAVDKLVDSAQLNADLTSVANAIRTKGGTSASLAFPAGFAEAIDALETGGASEYASVPGASSYTPGSSGHLYIDFSLVATRMSLTKAYEGSEQFYARSGSTQYNSIPLKLYAIDIPSGAEKVSIRPDKNCQVFVNFFSKSGSTLTLVSNSGWLTSPVDELSVPTGTNFSTVSFRTDGSNTPFTAQTALKSVAVSFS